MWPSGFFNIAIKSWHQADNETPVRAVFSYRGRRRQSAAQHHTVPGRWGTAPPPGSLRKSARWRPDWPARWAGWTSTGGWKPGNCQKPPVCKRSWHRTWQWWCPARRSTRPRTRRRCPQWPRWAGTVHRSRCRGERLWARRRSPNRSCCPQWGKPHWSGWFLSSSAFSPPAWGPWGPRQMTPENSGTWSVTWRPLFASAPPLDHHRCCCCCWKQGELLRHYFDTFLAVFWTWCYQHSSSYQSRQ